MDQLNGSNISALFGPPEQSLTQVLKVIMNTVRGQQ
jgi:hypothetical protein